MEGTPRLFWGAPRLGGSGSFPRGAGAPLRFGAAALRRFKPPFFPCPSRGRGRLGAKRLPPMRVLVFWGPAAGDLFWSPAGSRRKAPWPLPRRLAPWPFWRVGLRPQSAGPPSRRASEPPGAIQEPPSLPGSCRSRQESRQLSRPRRRPRAARAAWVSDHLVHSHSLCNILNFLTSVGATST